MSITYLAVLKQTLEQFREIGATELDAILNSFTYRPLDTGALFPDAYRTSSPSLAWLETGIMRIYDMDEAGDEQTRLFLRAGDFVGNLSSFLHQQASDEVFETVTPCRLAVLSHAQYKTLLKQFPHLQLLIYRVATDILLQINRFHHELFLLDATERYQYFIRHYQDVHQQIPLKYVASYLRIAPPSLSRIRRQLK